MSAAIGALIRWAMRQRYGQMEDAEDPMDVDRNP
jgi:hypothetical protein